MSEAKNKLMTGEQYRESLEERKPVSARDRLDPKIKAYLDKYLVGDEGVDMENRMKIMRLIENLTLGSSAVGYLVESLHGAGSPQTQRIMIGRLSGLEEKKKFARRLASIKEDSG